MRNMLENVNNSKVYKCNCGKISSIHSMDISHEVRPESIPLYDYDDLTPSCLIEWETKRRFFYMYHCPQCGEVLVEQKGILF